MLNLGTIATRCRCLANRRRNPAPGDSEPTGEQLAAGAATFGCWPVQSGCTSSGSLRPEWA